MIGTNATTGKAISGIDRLRQGIRDILGTPLGTRVMRPTYGSELFDLLDAPMNRETLMRIYAATVDALQTWEPELIVSKVTTNSAAQGAFVLDLDGIYVPTGQPISVNGIKIQ